MKRCTLFIFILYVVSITLSGQPYQPEKITLPNSKLSNLHRVDEDIYRSDQPTTQDFKLLEDLGIQEILNLRRFHSNRQETRDTNLKIHRIKTYAHTIGEEEVIDALKIIQQREGPILIHCLHGSDRTGAVVAMYRIVFHGLSKEEAIEEMEKGGFGFHKIFRNIVRMIEQADIEMIRNELGVSLNAPIR